VDAEAAEAERGAEKDMAKVMVVDDAQSDLKMMESILQAAGHQVLAYATGERLEDKLAAEQPDVLLLDIVMPQRNGYDILRAVKKDERTRHTPVVLVTSKTQESDKLWGRRQGADEYVTKPFTPEQLVTVVRRFTGEARARG
jgi:twitching motility two-component system response regulator PilH